MAQILDPIPNGDKNSILCCYVNRTSNIQIARITNIPNWYFERVVFPGQRLIFEAVPEAALEIHTGMMASAILSDTISCQRIRVNQGDINNNYAASITVSKTTDNKQNKQIKDSKINRTTLKQAVSIR